MGSSGVWIQTVLMLGQEALTHEILASAIEVHRGLGPGLLESVYEDCFCWELDARGLRYRRQVGLPVTYKRRSIADGYRIDVIVDEAVIVEHKVVEGLLPIHASQLLTYLRLSGCKVGLLINWNVCRLMDGVIRRVLT
jgi:GxxExxY protein